MTVSISFSLSFFLIAITNLVAKRRIDLLDKRVSSNIEDINNILVRIEHLERISSDKQKVER